MSQGNGIVMPTILQGDFAPEIERFYQGLPHKPLCADNPKVQGSFYNWRQYAVKRRLIQVNPKCHDRYLIFDVDHHDARSAAGYADLPPPTITVINPANGHAHLFYELETPVFLGRDGRGGRQKPRDWLKALLLAFRERLEADPGYVGKLAKNPLHPA